MPSILVVCTADQCRSPMAVALLRRRLADVAGDWRVSSAGVWPWPGASATPAMQATALSWGLDLSAHRSREVEHNLLAGQHLVLVMERGHKEALSLEFPETAGRTHLLSELAGPAYDVADPIGGSPADYAATATELDQLIERGLARIIALAGNANEQ